ncbi:hypothetical protein MT996_09640 [Ornithobacterium rhinotracheale]|uniref:hypothetical protein n=1 Tax=Ornithobacterium rhinotracheale TaxID=28251 RepID=UPI00162343F3|nr:hypothetical protein [Ornithobacterium rhinotracheale]UOH77465.1 hypothetical protein MT996_09640 [Ornithobacterium rhinotracheale]
MEFCCWGKNLRTIAIAPDNTHTASAVGRFLWANPTLFKMAEKMGHYGEKFTPNALIYLKANGYGQFHDMPKVKKETFRDWYLKNRKEK